MPVAVFHSAPGESRHTLRKDMFLPSEHLLKNLTFTHPYMTLSKKLSLRCPNTIRTEMITNENLEILFCFRFRNGKANKFPRFSFVFAFVMVMLGTHKPQQQATLTNIKKQRFSFAFAFVIQQR